MKKTTALMTPRSMTIESRRARNPLVAPSLFRRAGAHRASGSAQRQQAARVLEREIAELPPPRE